MHNYQLISYNALKQMERIWLMANGLMIGQTYCVQFYKDMVIVSLSDMHVALPNEIWDLCLWQQQP